MNNTIKRDMKIELKRNYIQPLIEIIRLDNEISLALESEPPEGPYESSNTAPNYLSNDPFKIQKA